MSLYECLRIYQAAADTGEYLAILQKEFGVQPHPEELGSFVVEEPPIAFYRPTRQEDYFYILSFNYGLLPLCLIQALVNHPEFAPPTTRVLWTAEQDLIYEGQLKNLARRLKIKRTSNSKK